LGKHNLTFQLPLDINESVEDASIFETTLLEAQGIPKDQAPSVSTSLSCFIHICRLRRIESEIQQTIYRVDDSAPATEAEVERFIQKLDDWRERIPADARQHSGDKASTNTDTRVIDGYGYYVCSYWLNPRYIAYIYCRWCTIINASDSYFIHNYLPRTRTCNSSRSVPKLVEMFVRLTRSYIRAYLLGFHSWHFTLFSLLVGSPW